MAELYGISWERHGDKRWTRPTSYNFTRNEVSAVLLAQEMPAALLHLPIGFFPVDTGYLPVAILGLRPQQNTFAGPRGEWLGDYIPLVYRNYPFQLGKKNDTEKFLCIDESSGIISSGDAGERFFIDEKTPSETLMGIFKTLVHMENEKERTRKLCELLNKYELIEKWEIKATNGVVTPVTGLYRINEKALNALEGDKFLELRNGGALLLAYCQLLSMRNLAMFATPPASQPKSGAAMTGRTPQLTDDNGIISFENL